MVHTQWRYLLYFISSAVFLGCLVGLASFWITTKLITGESSNQVASKLPSIAETAHGDTSMESSFPGSLPVQSLPRELSTQDSIGQPKKVKTEEPDSKPPSYYDSVKSDNSQSTIRQKPAKLIYEEQESHITSPLPKSFSSMQRVSSPAKMTSDGKDTQGRDRFDEAMRALARKRKQSPYGAL